MTLKKLQLNRIAGATAALAVVLSALAGCNPDSSTKTSSAPAAKASAKSAAIAPAAAVDPSALVVEVDGVKLTKGDMDKKVDSRLARIGNSFPKDRLPQILPRLQQQVADEFVMQTLLLKAADQKKITATEADMSNAIERVTATLPSGVTLDQILTEEGITKDEFRKDMELQVRITKLVEADAGGTFKPTDEEIAAFYGEKKDKMSVPESVHARHILLTVESGDTDAAKAEKKAKAEALRKQLVDGADFAALAKTNSDCPSKARGGDLGSFARGQMVKPFEDAAFSQKTNEISNVVETQFGYHIIQVLEHKQAKTLSMDDARDSIVRYLTDKKRQDAFEVMIERLKKAATIKYGTVIAQAAPEENMIPMPEAGAGTDGK